MADRVRQVKRLRSKKARSNKYNKKEKVAYVKGDKDDNESNIVYEHAKEGEVNVVELKLGSQNVCKLLKPSGGKNPVEPSKNEIIRYKIIYI